MIWTQQSIEHYIRNAKAQYNVYYSCSDGAMIDILLRYIEALGELRKYVPAVPKFKANDHVTFKDVHNYDGSVLIKQGTYLLLEVGSLCILQDGDGGCIIVAQDTVETFGE